MQNPFRYFNSSPEVIRLTVMMYIRYPLLDFGENAAVTHENTNKATVQSIPRVTHV